VAARLAPPHAEEGDVARIDAHDETGLMEPHLVTVTIRDDEPRQDGSWAAVDAWGREVFVMFREDVPRLLSLRRGQSVRGTRQGHLVVDAVL
jgi:hypothetical protein